MKNYILFFTAFILSVQMTAHAEIKADYIFTGSLTGNIAEAPDIEFLGSPVNFEMGLINGFSVDAIEIELGSGLRLDLSQWNLCDEFTIVLHGYLDDIFGYKKLIDFREGLGDAGLYNNAGKLEYVVGQTALNTSLVDGIYFQLVMTRAPSGEVKVYLDRELQLEFMDDANGTSLCFSNNLYFFKDDTSTGIENPSGGIARITIYDTELSADEVGELEILDIIFFSDFELIQQP